MLKRGFAAAERLGNLRHTHAVDGQQIDDESGLLQNTQGLVARDPHQTEDARRFLLAEGNVGHAVNAQLFGATVPFETVEQEPALGRVHAFQRLLDATLCDRRQQARFASVVP